MDMKQIIQITNVLCFLSFKISISITLQQKFEDMLVSNPLIKDITSSNHGVLFKNSGAPLPEPDQPVQQQEPLHLQTDGRIIGESLLQDPDCGPAARRELSAEPVPVQPEQTGSV